MALNLWKDHFTMFELTEIMKQKDYLEFARLLNRLRHNKMTPLDKKQIDSCIITAPHIFAENYFMDKFNQKISENLLQR